MKPLSMLVISRYQGSYSSLRIRNHSPDTVLTPNSSRWVSFQDLKSIEFTELYLSTPLGFTKCWTKAWQTAQVKTVSRVLFGKSFPSFSNTAAKLTTKCWWATYKLSTGKNWRSRKKNLTKLSKECMKMKRSLSFKQTRFRKLGTKFRKN